MAKTLLVLVVVGLGVYYFSVLTGRVRYEPSLEEVNEKAKQLESVPPAAPDPRKIAAGQWLGEAKRGRVVGAESAPDWTEGTRLRVHSSKGTSYLFYFGRAGTICGVWTQEPRGQIFQSENCP